MDGKDNRSEEIKQLVDEGVKHFKNGEEEKAIECCNKILELDPNFIEAYYNRGNAYTNLGAYLKAIKDYNKVIELGANNSIAYYSRGIAYAIIGEHLKAVEDFTRAIEIDPKYTDAYNNRATIYFRLGENEKAIEDFTKAIEIDPKYSEAYINRGLAYGNLGGDEKAIKDFNKAIEINPNDSDAYYNRGLAYSNLGENEKAIKSFESISKNEKYFSLAQLHLGSYYQELKNYDKALEYYNKIPPNDPNYTSAQVNIGRIEGLKNASLLFANKTITDGYIKKIVELNKAIDKNQKQFTKYTRFSAGIIFIVLGVNIVLAIFCSDKNINWLMITVSGTSIAGLLLWIARYFNRRIHEDIHLKEEYEHRKILLEMFETYAETIEKLSAKDNPHLLDFTKSVSNIVSKSPANSLNRKKGDSSAINDCIETIANYKKIVE